MSDYNRSAALDQLAEWEEEERYWTEFDVSSIGLSKIMSSVNMPSDLLEEQSSDLLEEQPSIWSGDQMSPTTSFEGSEATGELWSGEYAYLSSNFDTGKFWSVKRVFRDEEEKENVMKQDDVEKCLLVSSIPLNSDIQNQIASFAFHDNHDYEFQHRKKMKHVFHDIEFAYSRKNGFNGLNKNYSNDEEWTFETIVGDVHMQANSCHTCGNYSMSNTFYIYHAFLTSHERILCHCNHDNQLVDDEEEEDEVDW